MILAHLFTPHDQIAHFKLFHAGEALDFFSLLGLFVAWDTMEWRLQLLILEA